MPERNYKAKVVEMQSQHAAQGYALSTVLRFNTMIRDRKGVWFWPTVGAALVSHHHWLIINCESCRTVIDVDLRVKPRNPENSIRAVLPEVRCPRCNGNGRLRIKALAARHSI